MVRILIASADGYEFILRVSRLGVAFEGKESNSEIRSMLWSILSISFRQGDS